MLDTVRAWYRFRGWKNVYWREDWYESRCSHSVPVAVDNMLFCDWCGKVMGILPGEDGAITASASGPFVDPDA